MPGIAHLLLLLLLLLWFDSYRWDDRVVVGFVCAKGGWGGWEMRCGVWGR